MCLLAVLYRVVDDAPLIVGANREEAYARIGEPPQILDGRLRAVGGRDPVAGGTWLGLNERGVLVAVTNRPRWDLPATPRSRGLLVRDLLQCASAGAAMDLAARELGGKKYAGCNVVCADMGSLYVVQAGDWLRVRPMPPGIHVLTTHDVDDASDRRLGHALWWLNQRRYARAAECVAALQELCAQTGNGDPAICVRGPQGGTISSSIVVLRQPLARGQYLHAQGPPDTTPYADYSNLLTELGPVNGEK
jgi:uncharacterized protein with NRDE domain